MTDDLNVFPNARTRLFGEDTHAASITGSDTHAASITGSDTHSASLTGSNTQVPVLTGSDTHAASITGSDTHSASLSGGVSINITNVVLEEDTTLPSTGIIGQIGLTEVIVDSITVTYTEAVNGCSIFVKVFVAVGPGSTGDIRIRRNDVNGVILTNVDISSDNLFSITAIDENSPIGNVTYVLTVKKATGANNLAADTYDDWNGTVTAFNVDDTHSASLTGSNTQVPVLTGSDTHAASITGSDTHSASLTGSNTQVPVLTGSNTQAPALTGSNDKRSREQRVLPG